MLSAPIPLDEEDRLRSLQRYCVLDTPAEPAFDRLTHIAAHLLGVPTVLVSLVDAERQWFKSRVGLDASQTPRDISFCGHAVYQRAALVVPDATQDPRFADNPLVTGEPGLRFYAGTPLMGSDGHALGTLCAIDYVARPAPSAEQMAVMAMLADAVVAALELRLHVQQADARLELSQLSTEVATTAHRANDLSAALPAVLAALCRYAGAQVGHVYLRGGEGPQEWVSSGIWHAAGGFSLTQLQAHSGALAARAEGDWPQLACMAGTPQLSRHIAAAQGPRAQQLLTLGLREALLLSFRGAGQVQGIVECYGRNLLGSDADLITAAGVVAAQLECVAERALAQRMKDDFVNTVSHELRTPLTSIAGMLALLDAGRAGPMSEKAGHMIDVAHRNSLRLTRLVSDILDLGKIESGQLPLHMQAQALMPLIERAISENQAYAQGLGVSLAFEGEPSALAARVDTDRAIQILTNLMSNAAKFSPPGGVVRVSMQRRHDRVRIAVADRGPGIPKDFRSKIFTRFAQAEGSEGHQAAGTGLGLAIVQRLVQAMGGEVGFDTEEGVGTAFHIDLPWCLAETAAHSAAEAEASITA